MHKHSQFTHTHTKKRHARLANCFKFNVDMCQHGRVCNSLKDHNKCTKQNLTNYGLFRNQDHPPLQLLAQLHCHSLTVTVSQCIHVHHSII